MKTIFVNEKDQKREWFIIDASGKSLGRVASAAAKALRGKTKVTFTPNQNMGDYIVIINADKVNVTGGKEQKKVYYRHTGFVGGLKSDTFESLIEKPPFQSFVLSNDSFFPLASTTSA